MSHIEVDIAILGSGFAGSICTLVLKQMGFSTLLIDKSSHPRFAIGESSTPIGNMVLRDLAKRYGLNRLAPLSAYGSWKDTYPEIACGRKRGFSYFKHEAGVPFQPDKGHTNELLVTANTDDDHADTHWFREDVDAFLINEVQREGIPVYQQTWVQQVDRTAPWTLHCQTGMRGAPKKDLTVKAWFIIDATGRVTLPDLLGIPNPDQANRLKTHTRSLYGHFEGIPPWRDQLINHHSTIGEHPYDCDDAAVHHVMDAGWLWALRFDNGRTSTGLVFDPRHGKQRAPAYLLDSHPQQSIQAACHAYPSIAALFDSAILADPPGHTFVTPRLQRLSSHIAGDRWALLPHSAGFIDPLHSTGIAHSLLGLERLSLILQHHWKKHSLSHALAGYQESVHAEFAQIDRLVAGCYASLPHFKLFIAYTMLYFAAAITFEEYRLANGPPLMDKSRLFLCAEDVRLARCVDSMYHHLLGVVEHTPDDRAIDTYINDLKNAIEPYNTVGLFTPRIHNMYEYTATT